MKKFAFIIAIFTALFFVGCSSESALSFQNDWSDGSVGYTENLVYQVTYDDDYAFGDYDFTKSAKDDVISCDFNGSYYVTNKILNANNENLPDQVKNSDVMQGLSQLIMTVTELNVAAEYTYGGKTETYTDVIKTVGYFCSTESSLSPIYSATEYDYTIVKIVKDSASVHRVKGADSICYSSSDYKVIQKVLSVETGEELSSTEKTFEYTKNTLIDNTAFFLAARNLAFSGEYGNFIPTVHPAYGQEQTLQLTQFDTTEIKDLTVIANGEVLEGVTFSTEAISYHIDSTNMSGASQLLFRQNGEASGIADKSLIVRSVSSISDYSSYAILGSLVYTLSYVDYSK